MCPAARRPRLSVCRRVPVLSRSRLSSRKACGNVRTRPENPLRDTLPRVPTMDRTRFERLVTAVVNDLPEEFAARLANVEVVVEDEPTRAQLRGVGLDPREDTLFGL